MNDIFLQACQGKRTRPVPVWLMRQAGRYLPAYQKVRGQTDFLTLCKTPELAAKVTLQPVDILGVDAAILFSDILIPLEAMGVPLAFEEGRGPVLEPPVRCNKDVERLHPIDPVSDVPFVLETIRILKRELENKVPLIGFSGAPFTLASYLIEGGTTRSFVNIKRMMFEEPALFDRLMDLITQVTIAYLDAQIRAGVQAVQVFDTWGGILSRQDFRRYALPWAARIMDALKNTGVPRIYFVLDGGHLLDIAKEAGAEVLGVDWRTDLDTAAERTGGNLVLQGNLDPCCLFLPEISLQERVKSVLEKGARARAHVFNLGHGVMPEIPAEKARLLVELVHELSA